MLWCVPSQTARGAPAQGKSDCVQRLMAKIAVMDSAERHPHPSLDDLMSHPLMLAAVEGSVAAIDAIAGGGGDVGIDTQAVSKNSLFSSFQMLMNLLDPCVYLISVCC